MELKKIQYFLKIVEKGSLSKAAQSLYLTQPTLSRFLSKLEEEAGVSLFLRKKDSSLELTEAGKKYLDGARRIDEIWRCMESDFSAMKEAENEHIRIGIDNDVLHTFVRTCADKVAETYPKVTVETHYLNSEEIQIAVLEGRIDMGLTSYYQFDDRLTYTNIEENEIDLVVSKNNYLSRYSYQNEGNEQYRLKLNSLPASTPFLLMRKGNVLRQCIDSYMEELGITPYVPMTYFRLDYLGKIIYDNEELVGFCPRNHLFKGLYYIALEPPVYHRRGLCFRKGKSLTAAKKLLINQLSETPKKWVRE